MTLSSNAIERSDATILTRLTRQLTEYALALALSVAVLLGVLYTFHWLYVSDLAAIRRPKNAIERIPLLDNSTFLKVGNLVYDKQSSFTNFAPAKSAGVLRIGAFGDSHTYGDEVDATADFPSQLSRLLRERGITNVEVLNFGSSWHGFGQAFILWEDLAKKFGLDVVILGPKTFHADRDTKFNHTDGFEPYYIHSRFIVEDGALRRLDPAGATLYEKFENYYSFWPKLDYLRYDRNTPSMIQAVLPEGMTIDNPFYYDARPKKAEAGDIYKLLVKKIIDSGVPLIIAEYPDHAWLNDTLRAEANDRTCVVDLPRIEAFPYLAPKYHDTSVGNQLVAQQFLSLLLGAPIDTEIVHANDPPPLTSDRQYEGRVRTDLFDAVTVKQDDREVGGFVSAELDEQPPSFIKDNGFQSLLALSNPGGSALDAIYLGLKDAPEGAVFSIEHEDTNGGVSVSLGTPKALSGTVKIDMIPVSGLRTQYRESAVYVSRGVAEKYLGGSISGGSIGFRLGSQLLLKGPYDPGSDIFRLVPVNTAIFFLRAHLTSPIEPNRLAGQVDLVAKKGGQELRTALAELQVKLASVSPFKQCQRGWKPPL